ncbi:hypothetical protein Tco_1326660 [Tanacetum coccineum]
MATPVIDLTVSHPVSIIVHALLPTSTSTSTTTAITTTTSLPPPLPQPKQSSLDPILLQHIGELEQHIADLIQSNLAMEERLDKHGTQLYNLKNLNIPQKVRKAIDEIVTDAVDWVMQAHLRARFSVLPAIDMKEVLQQRISGGSSQEEKKEVLHKHQDLLSCLRLLLLHLLTTSDTRYESTGVFAAHESSPADSLMNEDSILVNSWASASVSTYEPPAENLLLAKIRDMMTFMNWYCSKVNKTVLTQADFKGQAYKVVKAFYPDVIYLQFQMEECHKMLTD